jgi:hypothetical protein
MTASGSQESGVDNWITTLLGPLAVTDVTIPRPVLSWNGVVGFK